MGQQLRYRDPLKDQRTHDRRPAQTPSNINIKGGFGITGYHSQSNIVSFDQRAVLLSGANSNLEFSGQKLKLRMIRRPLPDPLRIRPGVGDLIQGSAGKMIGGDVANGITTGLDSVHIELSQRLQNVRGINQARPIKLDVLPGGEVAIALVPALGNICQPAQLGSRQRAIGYGHAQHVSV